MMSSDTFQTTVYAKWILAGEHAVLRGKPAIVYPLKKYPLTLNYRKENKSLTIGSKGKHQEKLQMLFWGVIEKALAKLSKPADLLQGHITIDNQIPIGAGLGASAAICSAASQLFSDRGWISNDQIFTFARELEDLFHGKSSGLDIVGALANSGIRYQQQHTPTPIRQNWQPQWFLSYSEQIGVTEQCIYKVNELWQKLPDTAKRIDNQMEESVKLAEKALQLTEKEGVALLAQAINAANLCFSQWGLTEGAVSQHINALLKQGALAVKPTGSGNGGYLLSLWEDTPPKTIQPSLITV